MLKNILSIIVVFELLVVITLLTQYSYKKLDCIHNSSHILSLEQEDCSKDTSLAKVIKDEEIIKKVFASFNYKKYQQSRYMPLASIFPNNPQVLTENIELKAKKLLGKPYVWGATGPNCFDCSGFTQKVYRMVGINLPRVSKNQAKVGKLVRFNELQKGDIVFFDTSHKNRGIVNHVGIYLGNGKFIHASSGKHKVVITNFDKKRFYKNRFLWGRRIIKSSKHLKTNTKLANILNLELFPKVISTQEL
ncbi:MAG: C40 family peptidase [Sulfurovaceae bacterium]|nr:C40 family peptidase [Sulfurovaceae bacterium]